MVSLTDAGIAYEDGDRGGHTGHRKKSGTGLFCPQETLTFSIEGLSSWEETAPFRACHQRTAQSQAGGGA